MPSSVPRRVIGVNLLCTCHSQSSLCVLPLQLRGWMFLRPSCRCWILRISFLKLRCACAGTRSLNAVLLPILWNIVHVGQHSASTHCRGPGRFSHPLHRKQFSTSHCVCTSPYSIGRRDKAFSFRFSQQAWAQVSNRKSYTTLRTPSYPTTWWASRLD